MNARRVLAADGVPSLFTLLVVFAIFSLTSSEFLSIENVRNILVQSTFVLFISVGMTFVLTVGAIDLSVGTVLGFSAGVTIFVISLGVPSVDRDHSPVSRSASASACSTASWLLGCG